MEKPTEYSQKDICYIISERTGYVAEDVNIILDSLTDTIMDILLTGGKARLKKFGVFETYIREPYTIKNPVLSPDDPVEVASTQVMRFKSTKEVRKFIDAPHKREQEKQNGKTKRYCRKHIRF